MFSRSHLPLDLLCLFSSASSALRGSSRLAIDLGGYPPFFLSVLVAAIFAYSLVGIYTGAGSSSLMLVRLFEYRGLLIFFWVTALFIYPISIITVVVTMVVSARVFIYPYFFVVLPLTPVLGGSGS